MLTKQELIEVMDIYIQPFYLVLGGIAALAVITFAWFVVIRPFIKRL